MRKLLLIGLVALRLSATVSNNVQFDVRTTGNDANGGGFITGATGTDFSQQDASQFSGTNLASSNGSTNPCIVTSASHNFVAADVGNLLNISAGTNWLTGAGIRYQIVSVSANAATLDRACGSAASLTNGTWAEGGAMATIGGAVAIADSTTTMPGGASATAIINVKAGTYTLTSTVTIGANTNMAFVGYSTTHGDNGTAPLITTATNSTALITMAARSHTFDNFTFTTTAATPAAGILGNAGLFLGLRNSSFSGFTNGLNLSITEADFIGIEVKNSTGAGITGATSTDFHVVGSWIHNNAGDNVAVGHLDVVNSIISNGTGIGVHLTASPSTGMCVNSVIANNGSDGWQATGASFTMVSCAIYGNGGFGVHGPGSGLVSNVIPVNVGEANAYGNNTSGDRSNYTAAPGTMNGTTAALNDVALTANPFTSATNFAPNATAGGGAALKGVGFPGSFPTGATTSLTNIGAVQSSGAAAAAHAIGYGGGYSPP